MIASTETGKHSVGDEDEENVGLVRGTVVNRYDTCNQCGGCMTIAVLVLVILNIGLTAALVANLRTGAGQSSSTNSASSFTNAACVNLCSPVCVGIGSACFSGCYTACNATATATFVRPAALASWLEANAIQHVGVTTSNLTRSVRFYTEVMGGVEVPYAGGDGWKGDDVYQLLMQQALMGGQATAQWAANISENGPDTLSARYISFGSMVIELLDYFSVEARVQRNEQRNNLSSTFPKWSSSNTAPSVAQNMHFSFNIKPERDLDEFVLALEAQAHAAGYTEVVCNRLVQVPLRSDGRPDYSAVPLSANSYVVSTGEFRGWHLAYCKGPDGEQLEFNQVAQLAADDFGQALQAYFAGASYDLW